MKSIIFITLASVLMVSGCATVNPPVPVPVVNPAPKPPLPTPEPPYCKLIHLLGNSCYK